VHLKTMIIISNLLLSHCNSFVVTFAFVSTKTAAFGRIYHDLESLRPRWVGLSGSTGVRQLYS